MNPYRVLGIAEGADADTIRHAYRRYVVTHHPDRGGDPAAFQRGVEAFRRLRRQPPRVPGTLGTHHHQNALARFLHRWNPPRRHRRRVD